MNTEIQHKIIEKKLVEVNNKLIELRDKYTKGSPAMKKLIAVVGNIHKKDKIELELRLKKLDKEKIETGGQEKMSIDS